MNSLLAKNIFYFYQKVLLKNVKYAGSIIHMGIHYEKRAAQMVLSLMQNAGFNLSNCWELLLRVISVFLHHFYLHNSWRT